MNSKIQEYSSLIEEKLYRFFENSLPEYKVLFESMEYSVKNGGKRVRPLLTLLFYNACGKDDVLKAIPMAEAVEFIHTYSLIHDDLPCMDNDDFRRGKPSNHKVYGETTALLAGDGLLTAAFERISVWSLAGLYDAEIAVKAIHELSVYAGARGMIGGQVIDIANENNPDADYETLQLMDNLKTGCLISVACALGCVVAGASDDLINSAKVFGEKLGLAFQIKDDILDVTSSLEKLGKMTGSDKENNKSTYVTLLGIEKCEELVKKLTNEALEELNAFPNNELIKEYADYLQNREY
ncbi:MAG: polyprenyl synthetase family protein [Ruminococcaceae bacterium]|nr:polyprenyl synthetase family protein [Oscillospiraceae bacterium]